MLAAQGLTYPPGASTALMGITYNFGFYIEANMFQYKAIKTSYTTKLQHIMTQSILWAAVL